MSKKLIFLASFVFVLGIVLTSVARADLIGWWRLDEASGTTAFDSSGNGNDGTLMGDPKWVAGILGGALSFDGTQDYVDCGSDSSLHPMDAITMAAWFMMDADINHNCFIMSCGGGWNDPGYHIFYHSGYNAFRPGLQRAGEKTEFDNTAPSKNEWHHIALIWDTHGDKIMRLYIDGEPQPVTGTFNGPIGTPGYNYWIGGYANTNRDQTYYQSFLGKIDDVRVYSHALRDVDIFGVMAGGGAEYPLAYGPNPADGIVLEDTWASLSWSPGDFALSHDVYFGDNFDDVNAGAESTFQGNQTSDFFVVGFPGMPFPDGLIPGKTYYWRIDEVNDTEPNSPWKGNVWRFMVPPKTAYLPDPADGAESVDTDVILNWKPGFGTKLHTVYFGETFEEVDSAIGGQVQGTTAFTPDILKMAKTYYWRVDEFDIVETHKGDVWSFTTEGGVAALDPANGAADVTQTPILTWAPGLGASYEIYFGADPASLELKGSGNLGSESYEPGQLEWNTTYYWRVDEANNVNSDSPWTGPLWSFTTANFLIIDDMESYNDLDPTDPDSNRIFNAWIDGFQDPTNGSLVGYDQPPFAEQTIVNSGNQSMPMSYDNSAAGKSEATLTLTSNRDWTIKDVNTLTIWFRGESANAAEQMYVTFNGSAKVDHDNLDAATVTRWTAWNIDLQKFADQGINLTNVNSITLGLSSVTGGTGMMYFDDIRLYPPAP